MTVGEYDIGTDSIYGFAGEVVLINHETIKTFADRSIHVFLTVLAAYTPILARMCFHTRFAVYSQFFGRRTGTNITFWCFCTVMAAFCSITRHLQKRAVAAFIRMIGTVIDLVAKLVNCDTHIGVVLAVAGRIVTFHRFWLRFTSITGLIGSIFTVFISITYPMVWNAFRFTRTFVCRISISPTLH
jgi:hypothetical protein